MANLNDRLVRLGIEIRGVIRYYDDLAITASGTFFASGISNESTISITNLNKQNRDWLMGVVNPYRTPNAPHPDIKVILEAGRKSTGLKKIYSGTIIRAELSQPPDITITMHMRQGAFDAAKVVTTSLGASIQLSAIAASVATQLGLSLRFEATDKLISNYTFNGSAIKQIDDLGKAGGVNAYADEKKLVVKNTDTALAGGAIILNEHTGMIGMPQLDYQGITVKCLIDAVPVLGGAVTIQSKMYPACNGTYNIYKIEFEIANRDTPFYWNIKASQGGKGL